VTAWLATECRPTLVAEQPSCNVPAAQIIGSQESWARQRPEDCRGATPEIETTSCLYQGVRSPVTDEER
jgi:hypothetical protein